MKVGIQKRRGVKSKVFYFVFLTGILSSIFGQGKFSGYMFGDYYYNISHNDSTLKGLNGFWMRRIYFTYDYQISENFNTRFRLEMNSPDYKEEKLIPYVKDAYLSYKKLNHSLILGISPTPTWEYIENFWGYRAVEKTPLDLYKIGDSRDFGIAFKGSFGKNGIFKYHIMGGNGEGLKGETNKGKKFMGSFLFNPLKSISFELYSDYGYADKKKEYVFQGFLGGKIEKFSIGVQYSHYIKEEKGKEKLEIDVFSLFSVLKISEKLNIFGRYDRVTDPLPWGNKISYTPFNNKSSFYLFIFGFDFHPIKNVSFIPNIFYVDYVDKTIEKDIQSRFTFLYSF